MTRVTFASSDTSFTVRQTSGGVTESITVQRKGSQLSFTLNRLVPPQEHAHGKSSIAQSFTLDINNLSEADRTKMHLLLSSFSMPKQNAASAPAIPKGFIEQPHSHPHRTIHNGPRPPVVGRRGDDFR